MWTLEQALGLIRMLQPLLHARKYHVALGGGVLNKGASLKDLDLYFFPFDATPIAPILPFLVEQWGPWEPLWGEVFDEAKEYPDDINFELKVKFHTPLGRIDAFMTKNGIDPNAN